ncbi:hypothetical protein B9N43_13080 [Denitratisoma sp. DHT3]|uniref:TolC family protein n=1 Tax=Denitratisoma sp. DHT3 TaxID=1981880 RepID=UPI0011987724|nr:TolC family protein [Denitratisoma sp. DHT3]QDX82098.1 hypothetical protein B9N43_13080 [Denitratisoma sp. DHT3]
MNGRRLLSGGIGLLLALPALAAPSAPSADLPPTEIAVRVLDAHPLVRAAESGVALERARSDQLEAGPHELALTVGGGRRRETLAETRYAEKEIGLQRAFRLPGKRGVDVQLGAAGVAQAQAQLGDARHEAARLLLALWFNIRREMAAVDEWRAEAEVLQEQARAARRRVELGDAAALEQSLAEAQLAQAEAQSSQARSRLQLARNELAQHFPALPPPVDAALAEPQPPAAEDWRERLLNHNHALAAARAAAQRQRIGADRAERERLPDPTLGLRWSSERDGQEKLFGVQLTIPLPGAARAAASRGAQAEAEVANAREALAQAAAEADARRAVTQADAAYRQWQQQARVAERMEANARLLDRAWRLGEGQLAELITARRLAIEARLGAAQARADAQESRYRLLLDAHQLWPLDTCAAHGPSGEDGRSRHAECD